jgi:hypothetical protein
MILENPDCGDNYLDLLSMSAYASALIVSRDIVFVHEVIFGACTVFKDECTCHNRESDYERLVTNIIRSYASQIPSDAINTISDMTKVIMNDEDSTEYEISINYMIFSQLKKPEAI